MLTTINRKRRFICIYVKQNENKEFKPNVVVIVASNEILAKAQLCETYNIPNKIVQRIDEEYKEEGIRSIRLSETNVIEGESIHENFRDDS